MSNEAEEILVDIVFAALFVLAVAFGIALIVGSYMREKAAEDAMAAAHYERVYLAGGAR